MNALDIHNLSKTYAGNIHALKGVSFSVPRGHIFGLLGPNGAGKTTLIKSLLEIIHATSGSAEILGKNYRAKGIKKSIGYLPENHKYPLFLSGYEVLFYYGGLSGIPSEEVKTEIPKLLKLVSMERWKDTKIRKYSKGMMQRIGLAQALIGNPDLIFLDEPTDGIDPVGRREIHDILKELKAQGKTIFINSHMLAEIESVCDSVGILKRGELVRFGSVEEITTDKSTVILTLDYPAQQLSELLSQSEFIHFAEGGKRYSFQIEGSEKLNELIDLLRQHNVLIEGIHQQKSSLEDSFINLVSGEAN